MLIHQSKGNLDEKILFDKITHHLDLEMRKKLVNSKFRTRIPHSILVHDLFAIKIEILFLKLIM